MQELRLVLIILGAVAIAALLLHGLWTSRKEKPAKFGEKPIGKLREKDDTGFDQDGIGSVRVIKPGTVEKPKVERKEPGLNFGDKPDVDPLFAGVEDSPTPEKPSWKMISNCRLFQPRIWMLIQHQNLHRRRRKKKSF